MVSSEGIAARLSREPLHPVARFPTASNATLLCWLGELPPELPHAISLADGDPDCLAVYKPRQGEAPLWDFPDGTLYRREIAAHVVDRLLGWDMVPVTVARDDGPFGTGSVQEFVPHDPDRHYFWMIEEGPADLLPQLERMVLFDLVVNNTDRKGGHVVLAPDGRIRLVDHGVCFHAEPKVRTVAWHFAGEPPSADDRHAVGRLAERLQPGGDGAEALAGLLEPYEIEATRRRAQTVSRMAAFPEPRGPRPVPWPML